MLEPQPMTDAAVDAVIARIIEIREEGARLRAAGGAGAFHSNHPLNVESAGCQARLATEFGRRHGWIRAKSPFGVNALAQRKASVVRDINDALPGLHRELFDHFGCYRESERPFRAAGISSHLYGWLPGSPEAIRQPSRTYSPEKLAEMHGLAQRLGLELTWPRDYPSWWNPGGTTLALLTPIR